ncbi:MAG TPA: hypothetical protein VEM96_03265 [Pyrinomonadaceae bacterium]|nr:hypothetical protein [Pyrinomonadaceae bacterium]
MRIPNTSLLFFSLCFTALLVPAGCQQKDANPNTTATTNATPPGVQSLTVVPRPQKIVDMMKARGEQDDAKPVLKIISPAKNAVINGSTVVVKLDLSGDLKGYMPHKDPVNGKGNHIHVILDNQPYEAYYELNQPFEMRNVTEGKHTLRVFPSRPWHESYKNEGAFQFVEFTVKGGGDAAKPTTTKDGQTMANPTKSPAAKPEPSKTATATASATPAREGKDFPPSYASAVDPTQPLLTYSRPKGEYKGEDADPIMIDFWLANAKLQGDGGQYRVRYTVNGEAKFIDKWEPIWLSGWISGKHTIVLELVDKDGNLVKNGGYNQTTRDITVTR